MAAITHDEIQCETRSLSRWVSDLAGRPLLGVVFQAFAVADRCMELAHSTRACMYSCPKLDSEPGCIPVTIEFGLNLATGLRTIAKGFGLFRPLLGRKLIHAAEAWEDVVEAAQDIESLRMSAQDQSPTIPLEQIKAELGL